MIYEVRRKGVTIFQTTYAECAYPFEIEQQLFDAELEIWIDGKKQSESSLKQRAKKSKQ